MNKQKSTSWICEAGTASFVDTKYFGRRGIKYCTIHQCQYWAVVLAPKLHPEFKMGGTLWENSTSIFTSWLIHCMQTFGKWKLWGTSQHTTLVYFLFHVKLLQTICLEQYSPSYCSFVAQKQAGSASVSGLSHFLSCLTALIFPTSGTAGGGGVKMLGADMHGKLPSNHGAIQGSKNNLDLASLYGSGSNGEGPVHCHAINTILGPLQLHQCPQPNGNYISSLIELLFCYCIWQY